MKEVKDETEGGRGLGTAECGVENLNMDRAEGVNGNL